MKNSESKNQDIEEKASAVCNFDRKKSESLNTSITKNEFLFLEQYQKDQK